MTNNKKVLPLVIGTLTLIMGMSLMNYANANLIAGSDEGATVTETRLYVTTDDTPREHAETFLDLLIGDTNQAGEGDFGLYAHVDSGNNDYQFGELASYNLRNQLQFSVNSCGEEDGIFAGYSCLNKLDANDEINADWFNGLYGNASSNGVLYGQYSQTIQNVTNTFSVGNWDSIGATGYVAFALYPEFTYSEAFLGTDIWQQDNVQYGWLNVTRGSISINSFAIQNLDPTSVPEPSSLLLLGVGLLGLVVRKKAKLTEK